MGITLKQLTDTVSQIKDYILNKSHKIDQINIAQKTVNTELDYCVCYGNDNSTEIKANVPNMLIHCNIRHTNLEFDEEGYVLLKANKKYMIFADFAIALNADSEIVFTIVDKEGNTYSNLGWKNPARKTSVDGVACTGFVNFEQDTYIGIKVSDWSNKGAATYSAHMYVTIQEIGREIVIDPVEHINTVQGIEDTPVGHIISHMGITTPKHYLICDGGEYNITDYPYLAQHIQDNFSTVNHFGGDGVNTFAVPNLISDEIMENIAPVMASNTTPTPYIVTESSFYNNICKGWKAFTGTLTGTEDSWLTLSGKTAGWVTIDLGEEKMINGFALVCRNSSTNYKETFPKDFTFEGSNDGVNFTVLKTITQESVSTLMERKVYMLGSQKYRYYKVNVTANNGGTTVGIGNIELLKINTTKCIKCEPTYFYADTVQKNNDPELEQIISQLGLILDEINGEVI